ncbi:hypothetical protein PTSG_04588 [Salpingoeca rosetta]|uniref:EF-hand domain-containing protein n=1 Tax=Salpingoeca rosetta (strain ATCC 50818 / BSB-021) TaxID=946362 RepID=F2U7V5_SALR5|nr:uncharacterized protein PTSG_04588 [Salpingoeca rosetta]EGD72860.1 hypothetical protein PTSG_04588 [Salpingoeca rosetta]|eukprot:XP_004994683.1 hypothetical protein PTSG_04588 [Salpingoeca rosetta]
MRTKQAALLVLALVGVLAVVGCMQGMTGAHAAPVRTAVEDTDTDNAAAADAADAAESTAPPADDAPVDADSAQDTTDAGTDNGAAKPVPVSKDEPYKAYDPYDPYDYDDYDYGEYEELYNEQYDLYADEQLDLKDEESYVGGDEDDDADPDVMSVRKEAAEKRRKADEEEYQRYLDEMMEEMARDSDLREDLIEDIQGVQEAERAPGDKDILKIALRLKNEERVRNIIEEKERQLLEAQRHEARRRAEARMHVPRPHDAMPEGGEEEDEDLFLDPEAAFDKLTEIVKRRAAVLGEIDTKRRAAFLQKEMMRELEFRRSVAHEKDPEKKKQLIKSHKQKIGHAKQLNEVWEKQDGMQSKFNPKVFFSLHDINGDDFWDHKELEAIFHRSAVKLHTIDGETDTDAVEEEMLDMRAWVMKEVDTDKDQLVSRDEFITFANSPEFQTNRDWKAVFPDFNGTELKEFKDRARKAGDPRQEHVQARVAEASKRFKDKFAKTMKLGTNALKEAIKPFAKVGGNKKPAAQGDEGAAANEQQQQQQQQEQK